MNLSHNGSLTTTNIALKNIRDWHNINSNNLNSMYKGLISDYYRNYMTLVSLNNSLMSLSNAISTLKAQL